MTITDLIRRAELGCRHAQRLAARHLARRCEEAQRQAEANPAMRRAWKVLATNWAYAAGRLSGCSDQTYRAVVASIAI